MERRASYAPTKCVKFAGSHCHSQGQFSWPHLLMSWELCFILTQYVLAVSISTIFFLTESNFSGLFRSRPICNLTADFMFCNSLIFFHEPLHSGDTHPAGTVGTNTLLCDYFPAVCMPHFTKAVSY